MKKIYYKLILMVVAVTTCSAIFSSCQDDVLTAPTRLFRPIIISDNIVAALDADTVPYIQLKWDKYADANQYVVKLIASDGTDSVSITTDSIGCVFRNLKFDKEYNIKIHSINTTNKLQSKDFITNVTTPDFPTQLVNIPTSNVIDTQVRITWNTTDNGAATVFDSLKVYNTRNDSVVITSAVTSDELSAGQKIIRKLQPTTNYRVEAYKNGKYKGKKLFTTTSSESYDGLVIDLRGLTATDSYKYFSVAATGSLYANSVDSIIKANPDQKITFVLQGGVTYRMPNLIIPSTAGNIKFVTGLSLNGKASFAVSGNFDAAASTVIGGLEFQKIFFTDAPLEGKGRGIGDLNFGGTYLFNFSGANSEIKSIKITDCSIKYKRGILRCKDAATIDLITVDNCIIDSIGGYGVVTADFATAKITNITVTNSTLSSCQSLFGGTKQAASPINSIDIENNTFVYCIANGKYVFDYSGCTVASFVLKNCVFGIDGRYPADAALTTGIKGWSGTVVPTADGCYFTSDYLWVLTTGTTTPAAQIPGTTLTTNTAQTFQDPTKSNFKVTSTDLKKVKAGDPRWY